MATKHSEIWRCGKYRKGYRAFWERQPYDDKRSYAWREGWRQAQFEAVGNAHIFGEWLV